MSIQTLALGGGGKPFDIEAVSEIGVRSGERIDALFLNGQKHGGKGGKLTEMKNIRVLGLGGRSGNELDNLRIHYIKDYKPSEVVGGRKTAIIGIVPQGETIETFQSSRVSRLNSTRRLFEENFSSDTSVSGEAKFNAGTAEYVAKASQSFGFTNTSTSEFPEQLETEEVSSLTVTRSPGSGFAGLEAVQVEVMKECQELCVSASGSVPF